MLALLWPAPSWIAQGLSSSSVLGQGFWGHDHSSVHPHHGQSPCLNCGAEALGFDTQLRCGFGHCEILCFGVVFCVWHRNILPQVRAQVQAKKCLTQKN